MNHTPLEVVLYTRIGCHLCEEAQSLLEKHGLAVRTIDINRDPELAAQYDQCVPVIVIDGRERFRGRVDEVLLRRLLCERPD
jgi:glutaredoxin